jgi:hypothetical protein
MNKKCVRAGVLGWALATCLALGVAGCASEQVVTQEQVALQNKVDGILSQELFARKLDEHASYNVHPDGSLAIKFDESVTLQAYTDLVEWLRARPEINGVRATQMGREVCPVRR